MGEKRLRTAKFPPSNVATSCMQSATERSTPAWMVLLLLAMLSLVHQSAGFRVLPPMTEDEAVIIADSPRSPPVKRTSAPLRGCYRRCQDCRNIYGYVNYDYFECAVACDRSGGARWDVDCGFRSEIKRTSVQQERISECRQVCQSLAETEACQRVNVFYQLMTREVCLDNCNNMRYAQARALTCTKVKARDQKVFSEME